tara:strand:- start:568 stop:915 length:348 start_codon:yes stop_codon:yes gene_type:complete
VVEASPANNLIPRTMNLKHKKVMPPFFYQGTIITDDTLEESGRMPVANGYYKEELKEAIPYGIHFIQYDLKKQADEIMTIRGWDFDWNKDKSTFEKNDASLFECITNKNQSDENK